jgi:hypothetical protein
MAVTKSSEQDRRQRRRAMKTTWSDRTVEQLIPLPNLVVLGSSGAAARRRSGAPPRRALALAAPPGASAPSPASKRHCLTRGPCAAQTHEGACLPRSQLSGLRPLPLGRLFGPSHAIGSADPRLNGRSPGFWQL